VSDQNHDALDELICLMDREKGTLASLRGGRSNVELVDAAREQLARLRQELDDARLMLRASVSHVGTSWLTKNGAEFWLNLPSGKPYGMLMNDGTDLPILTDEAREALRKGIP
jgi:hypothetical protein